MAHRGVTFFGEVGALRSRANWSDSEEEDEEPTTKVELPTALFSPVDIKGITTPVLYVSCQETTSKMQETVMGQVQSSSDPKIRAKLIKLSQNEYWLAVETSVVKKDTLASATLVYSALERLIASVGMVVILHVVKSDKEAVDYICNEFTAGNPLSSRFCGSKALPPSMVSSVPEAAAFEFCSTRSVPACLLLIPSQESLTRLRETVNSSVLESLQSFFSNHHLESNIYI